MSASRRGNNDSQSAVASSTDKQLTTGERNKRKKTDSASGENPSKSTVGVSETLKSTGAAAISSSSYSNQITSQIPMAEPVSEANRMERLFPPSNASEQRTRSKQNTGHKKNQGTIDTRMDYACDTLGLNKQNLANITTIDFCLDDVCRIDWVAYMPNLKELIVVRNGLLEIEGIDKCKMLESVWLSQNSIDSIRMIDKLPMLRQLYLSANKIRKIRNLEKCTLLEKLWLDENRIDVIEGIQSLSNLVELNLARNNIETIGIGLDGLVNLKELNISANRIGNFKEVLNLNRLPSLVICSFSDIHYGENPICSLSNYQTFVLSHLPRLVRLDTMIVSEDSKHFAETTFMKKRMYYNMRIKTIQRNTSNVMKLLKICRKVRIAKLDIQLSKLNKRLLEISRELEERLLIPQDNKHAFEQVFTFGPEKSQDNPLDMLDNQQLKDQIEDKRALIQGRIHDKNEDLKDLETIYESLRTKVYEIAEQNIHRLMTELETGGNIRFEEGRPQDRWFSSCVDLVRSRFQPEQMKQFGIIGVNVTRVTRIHNRFLKNRFEEKLEQLVDLSDNQYKRSLEYLFYGVNPQVPKEIHRAMEEGFRSYGEYLDAGLPGCISLVNSVASAEIARINEFVNTEEGLAKIRAASKAQRGSEFMGDHELTLKNGLVQIPSGQLLVCKIFLQKCTQDANNPYFDQDMSPSDIWRSGPVDEKKYPGVQSVYRTKENDSKQRMWFVLDHSLALPEYLVEFDYMMDPRSVVENKRLAETNVMNDECNMLFNGVTETRKVLQDTKIWLMKENEKTTPQGIHLSSKDLDRSDMGCLKKPLRNFMVTCHIKELMENNYEFVQNDKSGSQAVENSMPPEIPMRSQLDHISPGLIVNISREREVGKITYLNLFNNQIKKIEHLQDLTGLKTLILSFNQIEMIEGLTAIKQLDKLDLNHNFLRNIGGLEQLTELRHLDLRNNWITEIASIDQLGKNCSKLTELGLKCNPMASKQTYRAQVFAKVSNLRKLDGLSLLDKDKETANEGTRELTREMILENLKSQKRNFSEEDSKLKGETESGAPVDGNSSVWERSVEHLILNHHRIARVQCLEPFINLRKLKLLDNNITEIEGLENLRVLEELSLEKNKISIIQNLENLKYLKKLDLGSNKIKRITNVHVLTNLTQLSLENNEISRLDGLEELQCLMELYLGNNLISDIKETIKLKDLQRLIILDISGNPMSSQGSNYRIFCIFHLRKLRVLDGLSIDNQEHLEAKETFSGRLTEEILSSRLHGRKLSDMRELDLSNCKLRDFDDMFDKSNYPQLRELNLSNNQMSSLRGFGHLPSLSILKLRDNRIETLFCKPGPEDKNFKRGLFGLPNLQFLDVSSNQLQYLYGLQYSSLKELKILYAANNEIVKIEHLEKLRQLRELDLSKNRIRQIDMSSFLPNHQIVILKLDDNGLRSLANIEKLDKLQTLYVSNNRVQELFEIEKLAELPQLLDLSLISNPISRKPNYRMVVIKRLVQLLVLDGKEITPEERKRIEGTAPLMDPKQIGANMVHFQQYPTVKVPVKLNPVNFDGVFNNIKFQMEQATPQGQLPNLGQIKGQFNPTTQQDMANMLQAQHMQIHSQNPSQLSIGGQGQSQFSDNMGGMMMANNQMQRGGSNQIGGQDFNFQDQLALKQKMLIAQGRPSTNKLGELPQGATIQQQMQLNRQFQGMMGINGQSHAGMGGPGSQMQGQYSQFGMANGQSMQIGNKGGATNLGRQMGSKTQFRNK